VPPQLLGTAFSSAVGLVADRLLPALVSDLVSEKPRTDVTDWYKQSVYDPSNSKIGEIMDVLLSPDGKVNALIVGCRRLPRHG
jgi:hypothetical protein